jgi:hypothetical protein
MNNTIIQEVRSTREAIAAKFDFDLHRIFADAVARQATQNSQKASEQKQLPEQVGAGEVSFATP